MKKSFSLSIAAFSLALFSSLATAAYPESPTAPTVNNKPVDPTICFEDKVVKKSCHPMYPVMVDMRLMFSM